MLKKLFVASTVLGIFAIVSVNSGCSSGSDPTTACRNISTAACEWFYKCLTGAALMAVQSQYGMTAAECGMKQGDMLCKNVSSTCPSGMTYDGANADKCAADWKSFACTGAQTGPTSCAMICK